VWVNGPAAALIWPYRCKAAESRSGERAGRSGLSSRTKRTRAQRSADVL